MKMKRINRKIIALALCLGIIVSSFGNLIPAFAQGGLDNVKVPFTDKNLKQIFVGEDTQDKLMKNDIEKYDIKSNDLKLNGKDKVVNVSGSKDGVLYEGTRKSLNPNDPFANDTFNLTQEDIDQLVKDGHSLKDILEADEIGNRIKEEPKKLLDRKKKDKKDLKTIEDDVEKERKQNTFTKLKEKYPQEYQQLLSEKLNNDDCYMMLAFIDQNDIKSVKELVKDYKKDGEAALQKHQKSKVKKASKEMKEKYGLSDSEAEGVPDEMIKKLEVVSKKAKVSVKDLVIAFKQGSKKAEGGR